MPSHTTQNRQKTTSISLETEQGFAYRISISRSPCLRFTSSILTRPAEPYHHSDTSDSSRRRNISRRRSVQIGHLSLKEGLVTPRQRISERKKRRGAQPGAEFNHCANNAQLCTAAPPSRTNYSRLASAAAAAALVLAQSTLQARHNEPDEFCMRPLLQLSLSLFLPHCLSVAL